MKMETFLKLKTKYLQLGGITSDEMVLLSFIESHIGNGQAFFYTDAQILEALPLFKNIRKIKRIISTLKEKGLITTITSKEYFNDTKKWGNRRVILIPSVNTTSQPEEIKEEVEPTSQPEEIKEEVDMEPMDEYSDMEVQLNNRNVIRIKNEHKEWWIKIKNERIGMVKRLLNNTSQILFDLELESRIEELKEREEFQII